MTKINRRQFLMAATSACAGIVPSPARTEAIARPYDFPSIDEGKGEFRRDYQFIKRELDPRRDAASKEAGRPIIDFWSREYSDVTYADHLPPEIPIGVLLYDLFGSTHVEALKHIDSAHKTFRLNAAHQYAAHMDGIEPLSSTLRPMIHDETSRPGHSHTALIALDNLGPCQKTLSRHPPCFCPMLRSYHRPYPIHPELFDRLSKDWTSLPNFQRTRGVLRFMANVVGVLWHERVHDPLITPGRVPISNERIRAGVLYPLDNEFAAVVDKEVDGAGSLPVQIEANPQRRISQMRAATRAARAVFLCSAPLVGRPNAGLSGPGLRLACAEPGDQLAIFGEALRELSQRATYLYEEAGRYWFSTQPTLNRAAEDRAKSCADHEVDAAISKILVEDAGTKGGFHRVFAAPDDPTTIDEAAALSLVILGPSTPHAGKGVAKSAATDATADALTRCRASQRRFRNTLIFAAADEALLGTAREATRRSMAQASIVADDRLQQQLTQAQAADTKDKAKASRDGAQRAVRNAWSHILYPVKTSSTEAGKAFDLDHLSLTAKDKGAIPAGVYEKARGDGVVKEKLGPDTLWLKIQPLWPEDRPHLAISEIAEWFAAYVYLPKLRDRVVLDQPIRDALSKFDAKFGYAESFDATSNTYSGLIYAKTAPDIFGPSALVVRAEVALEQLRQQPTASPGGAPNGDGGVSSPNSVGGVSAVPGTPSGPIKPRRFYGLVEIDMVRPVKSFDAILNAVILELQRTPGAKVKVSLEITAEAASGFDHSEVGIVRDNAKQLKFRAEATGFEE